MCKLQCQRVFSCLHAQSEFSFHNVFDNTFRQAFTAGELFNLGNHFTIRVPFVFQGLGLVIVHVVHFGNPV